MLKLSCKKYSKGKKCKLECFEIIYKIYSFSNFFLHLLNSIDRKIPPLRYKSQLRL